MKRATRYSGQPSGGRSEGALLCGAQGTVGPGTTAAAGRPRTEPNCARRTGGDQPRGYLARLEAGQEDPTLSVVERLAKALRVPLTKLVK
jgi:hypothetical protein